MMWKLRTWIWRLSGAQDVIDDLSRDVERAEGEANTYRANAELIASRWAQALYSLQDCERSRDSLQRALETAHRLPAGEQLSEETGQ